MAIRKKIYSLKTLKKKRPPLKGKYPQGYVPASRRARKIAVTQRANVYGHEGPYGVPARLEDLYCDDSYSVTSEIIMSFSDSGHTIGFFGYDPSTANPFRVSFPYRQFQLFLSAMSRPQIPTIMDNTGKALRECLKARQALKEGS